MAVPDAFIQSPAATDGTTDVTAVADTDPAFWQAFGDPQLTSLVEQAPAANHDLRIALASYDRANALLRGPQFDYFPTNTPGAEGTGSHPTPHQPPGVCRAARAGAHYRHARH